MKKKDFKVESAALINAIHRCHNPNHPQYKDYGGRGIHVCDEWRTKDGFWDFLEHIGPKPSPELTLDRLNNERGYEHGNVGWRTRREQSANRRVCSTPRQLFEYQGNTYTANELAALTGKSANTLRTRYKRGYREDDLVAPKGALGYGVASKWARAKRAAQGRTHK